MRLQFLVSAVDQDVRELVKRMRLGADGVIVNQCGSNRYEAFEYEGHRMQCWHMTKRGVGLSRNTALLWADGDICLFADEDIVYRQGAAEAVLGAFARHPEADMLLFNVRVQEERRTYWTQDTHRVRLYNCGRYPAYSFALRTAGLREKNVTFSLLFGGGAKYANGEDSLFIRDCIRKGLRVYAVPVEIGEEVPRPSTWFHGYDGKFFHDRGVLYRALYGRLARPMGLRFLYKNRKRMCAGQIGFPEALRLLSRGVSDAKRGL